ncbi:MAG TPA: ribonuclease P protein component [Jiangellaceae bacterium]|nr:ribonuclease P protein component [Jiangellaceae bacterium]
MLPPQNRLRRTTEFRGTVRRGIRIGRPLLVVHAVPGVDAVAPPRAGFVVGRPVGDAVVRNVVRRRLRHLVRDRIEHLPPGTNVVIRARPEAARASRQALARDLDDALTRALAADRSASTLRGARP